MAGFIRYSAWGNQSGYQYSPSPNYFKQTVDRITELLYITGLVWNFSTPQGMNPTY